MVGRGEIDDGFGKLQGALPGRGRGRQEILSWRHIGFNVHSKVKTATRDQAELVASCMAKPVLASGLLAFDEVQGKDVRIRGIIPASAGEGEGDSGRIASTTYW